MIVNCKRLWFLLNLVRAIILLRTVYFVKYVLVYYIIGTVNCNEQIQPELEIMPINIYKSGSQKATISYQQTAQCK